MSGDDCGREREVIEAVLAGRWPGRVDDDLRAHVEGCAACDAVVELASALAAERETACADARIAPSGAVWWRAQMRARQEATRAATWPIAAVAGVMAACLVGFAVAVAPMLFDWLRETVPSAARFVPHLDFSLFAPGAPPEGGSLLPLTVRTVVWIGLAAWLVLAPAAIYLVLADDEGIGNQESGIRSGPL